MEPLFQALGAGALVGLAFPLGALLSRLNPFGHAGFAVAMAGGAGLLLAVALVDLLPGAREGGGLGVALGGFLGAALLYSALNRWIQSRGGENRKRCGGCVAPPAETERPGSGTAIVVGSVMDALPEAVLLGAVAAMGGVSPGLVTALVLGNAAQAMSATSGLRHSGRSPRFVWGLWSAVGVCVAGLSAAACFSAQFLPPVAQSALMAVAAGGLIAMIAEAMLPEASERATPFVGLMAALGAALFLLVHA